MNEKYLWDKTGEDFEIEKLENALKSLRYRETAAPLIPVKTATEKKSSLSFFPFCFPVTACFAIALLAAGFWLKSLNVQPNEIAGNITESRSVVQKENDSVSAPPIYDVRQSVKYEEKPTAGRRLNKRPKARPAYVRINTATAQKDKKTNPTDALTKEEKYAYDQLMTALAITNSQFRLVREKIKGIENQTADANGGR